jgi:hypothetical protein
MRLKLLNEGLPTGQVGNTIKYFKYAIGEIVLVMIGILLALQVNGWNQTRLEGIEEKTLLRNLHNEFLANKEELRKSTAIYKGALKANMILMSLIGSKPEELQKQNLDSLFYEALPSTALLFSDNAIKNIIQSGRLNIIQNPEIIQLMYQWEALSVLLKERETTLQAWLNNQMIPFISDYVAFKQIDSYGKLPWTGKSKLKPNYPALFQQLKFENIEDNVLWYHNKNYASLQSANDLINKIIVATRSYTQ